MPADGNTHRLADVVSRNHDELLASWTREQISGNRRELMRDGELKEQCREFLGLFLQALQSGSADPESSEWSAVGQMLSDVSASRTRQGFTSSETATFVFSLKRPLFGKLQAELGRQPDALVEETLRASEIIDGLGLLTIEAFQIAREQIILRQQEEMLELSTPVVKLWDGILALPIIGTLDSARSQVVMESLLTEIVASEAEIAIIDITGVPTVDTLTAQHLLKTVTAARLMGADCIISGIRPQIAQTIVHLGVDLNEVVTKASLAAAFALALERSKLRIVKASRQEEKS